MDTNDAEPKTLMWKLRAKMAQPSNGTTWKLSPNLKQLVSPAKSSNGRKKITIAKSCSKKVGRPIERVTLSFIRPWL